VLRRLAISCLLAALALPAGARTRSHYGGTLRIEIAGDPWQRPNGVARRLVLDGLTTVDADGSVRAGLAVEWESENANHRWQFRLRPGVHFHDGSPLTSVAAVASLNAACPANCPWTAVRAAASSVIFTGDAPMPNLPAMLAGDEFLIALTISADGKTPSGATGTGPFQVNGFNNGVLSLAVNDSCWQGRPFVDAIEIRTRRSVSDQWLDLSAGRADVVEVPAEELRQARQQRLTVVASQPAELLALQVSDTGALGNLNLRAAIAQAIDRASLANVIFQKEGQVTASLLTQSLSGYAFLFPAERDLNKAQQLRGGITPPALSMRTEGDGAMQLAAQRIALNLREAGFNVQLASPALQHGDLTLRAFSIESADPAAVLEGILRSQNRPAAIDTDPVAEYKAEREFLDRKTLVPLLYLPRAYAINPRVRDLQSRCDGSLDLADASLEAVP
jgi:peptide/nickel transport system substrate-binding protein